MPPKRARTEADHDPPVQPAGWRQRSSPGQGCGSSSEHSSVTAAASTLWSVAAAASDCSAPRNVRSSARRSVYGGLRGRWEAGSRVGGEAEGEATCRGGVCCGCGTDLDQVVHAVAACLHGFCCACMLEQATAINPAVNYCCGECGQEVRTFTLRGGGREDRSCEMPRRGQDRLRDISTATGAPDEGGKRCDLLSLPSGLLLERLWPTERVIVGLKVCHQLRRELSQPGGKIVVVKRTEADVCEECLARDCRRMRHLHVVLKWRGSGGLSCVASLGAALVHLDLSRIKIRAEGARILAGVLGGCKAVAHLDFSGNEIEAEGAGVLAGVLGECKALIHLDFRYNWIGDEGAGTVAGVLGGCKALAHLALCSNEIGDEGAGLLAGVLGDCKALTHLDLSDNEIGDKGAGMLSGALGQCRTLAHLDLDCNRIGDEGAGLLAGVLGECKALAHLALRGNDIGDEGVGRLAGVLGECKALARLNLRYNDIGAEGAGVLAGVLGECRALVHLDLRYNDIGEEELGRLAAAGTDRCEILT